MVFVCDPIELWEKLNHFWRSWWIIVWSELNTRRLRRPGEWKTSFGGPNGQLSQSLSTAFLLRFWADWSEIWHTGSLGLGHGAINLLFSKFDLVVELEFELSPIENTLELAAAGGQRYRFRLHRMAIWPYGYLASHIKVTNVFNI